jgi:fructokinase
MLERALGKCTVLEVQPLTAGLRNANFKLVLDRAPECVVLRVYEHDPSLCQKEIDLLRMVSATVRVPQVIHAEPNGWENLPPYLVMQFIEGISFRDLKRRGDRDGTSQAAFAIGETRAAIGRIKLARAGWIGPGLSVTQLQLEGADPTPLFVDLCLASANLQRRMPPDLRDRVSASVWSRARELAELDSQSNLVHGDFGKRNLLVRPEGGRWSVAAVLDWEYAVSGSPLIDLGHFLRYERETRPCAEPHFSQGYLHAGGMLPQDWRSLARVVDLTALCESLTHDDLPETVVTELLELIRATVEGRDAILP